MKVVKRKREKKPCGFCKSKEVISWEVYEKLGVYLSPRGRILAGQISGACAKHQKELARAIKQARHLGLLPFLNRV